MHLLSLRFDSGEVRIVLRRSATAKALLKVVPFTATMQTSRGSLMFDCPLTVRPEEANTTDLVQVGDIAFWSDASSLVIGFGPTPRSQGNEVRLAHPCAIIGDALDDLSILSQVTAGSRVTVSLASAEPLASASGE